MVFNKKHTFDITHITTPQLHGTPTLQSKNVEKPLVFQWFLVYASQKNIKITVFIGLPEKQKTIIKLMVFNDFQVSKIHPFKGTLLGLRGSKQ